MVRHPAATAASASISTPVRSTVRTVATTSTPPAPAVASTSTAESAIGWQSGTRSGVFFAAITPARRAAARTSPFSTSPLRIRAIVGRDMETNPRATATRSVFGFAPTSIIFMRPSRSVPRLRRVLAEPALRVDRGLAPRARGADRLAIARIRHVARREHARDARRGRRRLHVDVADVVHLHLATEDRGVRLVPDPHEHALHRELPHRAVLRALQPQPGDGLRVAEDLVDRHRQHELDLRVLLH